MTIQIISLIIALLAVIVGPIITNRRTKKNLEFQFGTMIKEHWVNKLEDAAHMFLNSTSEWMNKYPVIRDGSWHVQDPNQEIDRMLDTIHSSIIKMELLLDINIKKQSVILKKVAIMSDIIHSKVYDDNSINTLRKNHDEIIDSLQNIFHKERTKIAATFK